MGEFPSAEWSGIGVIIVNEKITRAVNERFQRAKAVKLQASA
jgi:hypothetical protein